MDDVMPWYSPGVFPTRTWVYAPSKETLLARWARLVSAPVAEKAELFKEGSESRLEKSFAPLAGFEDSGRLGPLIREQQTKPVRPIRVGYRSFDRQWIIPDARVIHRARPDLWAARRRGQVFAVELHTSTVQSGPGLTFSALIPDFHFFKGSEGGRTLPLLHPDGSANLAPGLLRALATVFGHEVTAADVLAYVAGVVAHPGYTRNFADELTTPGVRVPITKDPEVWNNAVTLGEQVIWLHTYGESFAGPGRPLGKVRFPDDHPRRLLSLSPITGMPSRMTYDGDREILTLGDGEFGPVPCGVWEYAVGGKNVLKSWFNYRKAEPGGKKTSPLDYINPSRWNPDWTSELLELLTVLTRLVDLEPAQAEVLQRVLAGELLSKDALASSGVRWPAGRSDRRPRHGFSLADPDDMLSDAPPSPSD